jgi:hypothetical protein
MEVDMSALSSIKLLTMLPLAAALAACAGLPQPFSQLDGHRFHRTPIDTYAVQIVRVDDRDTTDSPVFVEPGLRKVRVQGPPDGVHRFAEQREIDLNVAPCTRYYLVAVKPNRLMTDFSVKVDYEETIGGCSSTVASK